MIALDTNLLVYAHRSDAPFHSQAARVVAGLAEGRAAWALPWPCVHEFLAVVTHPRIFDPPSTLDQAMEQVMAWLQSPPLVMLAEAADHFEHLATVTRHAEVTGPRIHDARVAAICAAHGVRELWSLDRDFSRFPAVRVVNPCRQPPED